MGKLVCFTLTIVGFGVALLLGLPNIYGSSPGWSLLILILGVITAFGGAFTGYDDIGSRMAVLLFFICFAGSIIIMIFGFLNFYKKHCHQSCSRHNRVNWWAYFCIFNRRFRAIFVTKTKIKA
jgi:hypothetical protein